MSDNPSSLAISRRPLLAIALVLLVAAGACSSSSEIETNQEQSGDLEGQEESGTELALNESYDHIRNGARLILAYDAQSNSFDSTVCNTIDNTLKQVRVEVHLSNNMELGPTTPTDLEPGECFDVTLEARNNGFDAWSAHPEVGESGGGEHGNGEGMVSTVKKARANTIKMVLTRISTKRTDASFQFNEMHNY